MIARRSLTGILREPLVHFALLGCLIFGFLGGGEQEGTVEAENQIVISSAEVQRIADAWAKKWQRPPNEQELGGLIREAIREQVLYREALALGLDRDDVVIRRHLRQKYEFVTQDLAYDTEPDDDTLRAYHAAQPDRYAAPAVLSFRHILFDPDRRGAAVAGDAAQVLADLQTASDPLATDQLGDATALPADFDRISDLEVEAMFGPAFSSALKGLDPGQWAGPIPSGYGLHLVWVSEAVAGGQIPFETVRQRVKDDWVYDQRVAANEAVFQQLLTRYEVVVEPLSAAPTAAGGGT